MDPVEILIEEHRNILRGVELLEKLGGNFEKGDVIVDGIDHMITFFREYADIGHHQKEEDLLFTALFDKNPGLKGEFSPISELTEQHVEGRKLVGKISQKTADFPYLVSDYSSLIHRHINIEDNLFPELVDMNFDVREMEELRNKFVNAEDPLKNQKLLKLLDIVSISL